MVSYTAKFISDVVSFSTGSIIELCLPSISVKLLIWQLRVDHPICTVCVRFKHVQYGFSNLPCMVVFHLPHVKFPLLLLVVCTQYHSFTQGSYPIFLASSLGPFQAFQYCLLKSQERTRDKANLFSLYLLML